MEEQIKIEPSKEKEKREKKKKRAIVGYVREEWGKSARKVLSEE